MTTNADEPTNDHDRGRSRRRDVGPSAARRRPGDRLPLVAARSPGRGSARPDRRRSAPETRWPATAAGHRRPRRHRRPGGGGRTWAHRDERSTLFRPRDRRLRAGGPRGRLADVRLGPERRPVSRDTERRRCRGGRRSLARRAARTPRRDHGRLRERRDDGQLHRPGSRPPRGPAERGMGRRGGRADRCAAHPRHRRGRRSRRDHQRPPLPGIGARPRRADPERRRGPHGSARPG